VTVADADLEVWAVLSAVKAVRDAMPGVLVQAPGEHRPAPAATEEWVAVYPLSIPRGQSRRAWWVGGFLLQVTCFSRHGELRSDRDAYRPFRMAGEVREALEAGSVPVHEYGALSAPWHAALSLGKAQMQYLDETKVPAPAGGATGIHAVAITFTGAMATQ